MTAVAAVGALLSPLWAAEPDRASGLLLLIGVAAEFVQSFRRKTAAAQRADWASAGFTLLLALVLLNTAWLAVSALTRTGSVIGTPYYLAPEQIQDARAATPSSDQYALGVILYECLSGRRPFDGESLFSVFNAIVTERPQPLASRRNDLPPGLDRVVDRAMAPDAARRYPSVRALGRIARRVAQPWR